MPCGVVRCPQQRRLSLAPESRAGQTRGLLTHYFSRLGAPDPAVPESSPNLRAMTANRLPFSVAQASDMGNVHRN